jgi:hypothetical protein
MDMANPWSVVEDLTTPEGRQGSVVPPRNRNAPQSLDPRQINRSPTMADPTEAPDEAPHFETDDVEANLAIEQGLGVGARELAAQREPVSVVAADEDEEDAEIVEYDEQLSKSSDA